VIAALFVDPKGVYSGLPDVEVWGEARDARKYAGPWPVVAHPPCQRWGRYWSGGPSSKVKKKLGDDGGCFASALYSVRTYGGVLEHPEASAAWRTFGLLPPPHTGAWVSAGDFNPRAWTCCVEQGHYGHRARKKSWLYAVTPAVPSLVWGKSEAKIRMDDGFHSAEERAKFKRCGAVGRLGRLGRLERSATPIAFRDVLLNIAMSCL
jgi:hypothetical protein